MTEQKSLEQIIMDAIDFCTHTRCKKCEYYGKDSAHDYKGKCRGRMMADHLRKNGVVVREKGEWITPTIIGGRAFNIPHCSVCKGVPCGVDENTNFCPNCGADMRGRENG